MRRAGNGSAMEDWGEGPGEAKEEVSGVKGEGWGEKIMSAPGWSGVGREMGSASHSGPRSRHPERSVGDRTGGMNKV